MFLFIILKALLTMFLSFVFFHFVFQGCFDLFKYRDYGFLSVVLLILCTFTYLCVLGGIFYV